MFAIEKKSKRLITALIALVSLSLIFTNIQSHLISVSAKILPVEVSIKHLDFGATFPGENLQGDFAVSYADNGQGINYQIIQRRKPLPTDHPEYPHGGDPLLPGYYRNLCPYLTKVSLEGEGDIEDLSFVGPDDLQDKWIVYFSVPAIIGDVAQDHEGGLVSVNGEYGCDIAINIEEYCGDGIVNGAEECDDGNDNNDDGCRNDCTLPSICGFDTDVALVIDRSGSMGYKSKCEWWQLACINKPSCSLGYKWVQNTTYNQTRRWCNLKNQAAPHNSIWTEYSPPKLVAVKQIANNFLSSMGISDQSTIVSFATTASLDKKLSNDHLAAQTAINKLAAVGATDIGDAIKLAVGELTSPRINPAAEQIIILLTDGKANKPYGSGYGEDPADVAYALAEAEKAATAGIKIFTIGFNGDINADMLQQIANSTGGQYYFAATEEELDDVFASLEFGVCQ